jgi:hypothetical protein
MDPIYSFPVMSTNPGQDQFEWVPDARPLHVKNKKGGVRFRTPPADLVSDAGYSEQPT